MKKLEQGCSDLTEQELNAIIANGGLIINDTTPKRNEFNKQLDGLIYGYHPTVGPLYLTEDELKDYANRQIRFNEAQSIADFESGFAFYHRDQTTGECHRTNKVSLTDEVITLSEYDIEERHYKAKHLSPEEQAKLDRSLFEAKGQQDYL